MRVAQKFDGANALSEREYDIATSGNIKAGSVVKLSAGKVVNAATTETGALLGIAVENHSGSADALDPRANGAKILVCDCPDAVLACPAAEITATGGSTTTFTASTLGAYSNDDWNGGFIIDKNGQVHEITDYAYNSTGTVSTFTVATMAAAPTNGDKFLLFPPVGLAKGALDSTLQKVVHTGVSMTALKCVGRDLDRKEVLYKAASHF